MRHWIVVLAVCCGPAWAGQEPKPDEAKKPAQSTKAKELLDSASEMVSTATPAVQVAALMQMAQLYQDSDKKKALELLDQALAASAAVPPESGRQAADLPARVVQTAAELDVDKAVEMLPSLPVEKRGAPLGRIVMTLIERGQLDRAVEVLDQNAGQGGYPYDAASLLLAKLPEDDPRRVAIFGAATSSLDTSVRTNSFTRMLAKHWQTLPRPSVEAAVSKLVNGILDRKDTEGGMTVTMSSSLGSVSFENQKDYELFSAMHMLRAFDSKRADDILLKRPSLAEALQKFPQGEGSMQSADNDRMSTSIASRGKGGAPDPERAAKMRLEALASSQSSDALQLAKKDPQSAVSKAKQIPVTSVRAETLVRIAYTAAEQDPATGRSVLSQAITALNDIKEPEQTAEIWAGVADTAIRIKDIDQAKEAVDKGLADCAALYKIDTDAESPNAAAREYWPSMQNYRNVLYRAAKVYGDDADTLLTKITDPDLNLMGRIELARSLMGKPRQGMSISVSRGRPRS